VDIETQHIREPMMRSLVDRLGPDRKEGNSKPIALKCPEGFRVGYRF
jgi:hypothetical protein